MDSERRLLLLVRRTFDGSVDLCPEPFKVLQCTRTQLRLGQMNVELLHWCCLG